MYNIYTSYFSNPKLMGKMCRSGLVMAVCRNLITSTPPYVHHVRWIAPSGDLLYSYQWDGLSKSEFTEKYTEQLDSLRESGRLDFFVDELQWQKKFTDIFLLCYEKPSEFCHRHVLAKYLENHYGLLVKEF